MLELDNMKFQSGNATCSAITNGFIQQAAGGSSILILHNNSFLDNSCPQLGLNIGLDQPQDVITGNSFLFWTFVAPGANGTYGPNSFWNTTLALNVFSNHSGNTPVLTGSGAAATWLTDQAGVIQLTAATTATITFSHPHFTWTSCTANLTTGAAGLVTAFPSVTACVFTFPATTGFLNYHVDGN